MLYTVDEAVEWILQGVERGQTRIVNPPSNDQYQRPYACMMLIKIMQSCMQVVGYDATFLDLATRLGPRWAFEFWAALGRSGFDYEKDGCVVVFTCILYLYANTFGYSTSSAILCVSGVCV